MGTFGRWAHLDVAGNLIAVCNWCHDAIHRGDLHVTGNADQPFGLEFRDRDGRPIDTVTTPKPPDEPPPDPQRPYIHPYGERLDHSEVWVKPPPHAPAA